MNDLHETFKDEGLSIVGVTSEGAKQTDPWIEKHNAKFAYGYESGKLASQMGVKGIPFAVLVDPSGTIVWAGGPSSLSESTVRTALEGALKKPVFEWGKEAKKVQKAFKKGDFSKALEEAAELGEAGTEIHNGLKTIISGRMASLKRAAEEQDWLAVDTIGDRLEKQFKGLPEADEVETLLEKLKDKEAKTILKAQEKIAAMFEDRIKQRDIPKLQKDLKKILKDLPGTAAARDADSAMEDLRELASKR